MDQWTSCVSKYESFGGWLLSSGAASVSTNHRRFQFCIKIIMGAICKGEAKANLHVVAEFVSVALLENPSGLRWKGVKKTDLMSKVTWLEKEACRFVMKEKQRLKEGLIGLSDKDFNDKKKRKKKIKD